MLRSLAVRGSLLGIGILGLEAAYAVLHPAPTQPEFDPSGDFGDPEAGRLLKLVVLGDSSITAPGVDGPEQIWVRLIAERIAESRPVALRSVARGGATARTLIADQLAEAVAHEPDVAIVSIGANDAIRAVPVKRFEERLEEITRALADSGATVMLSGLGDLGTIPRIRPPLRGVITRHSLAYDRAHMRVAKRTGAVWLDPRQDDRALWLRDRSLWSADMFHVSAHGHARWARTAWPTVSAQLDG